MSLARRAFLVAAPVALVGCRSARMASADPPAAPEIGPTEDLVREHGILRRVALCYDEAARRLELGGDVPYDALAAGARIVRRVIEDYHEKLEEDFVFPRFEQAGRLADLVATLRTQHVAGRAVTDRVLAAADRRQLDDADRHALADGLRGFDRMVRAHAAREDTVLFPAFHELVGAAAFRELGERFEDRETEALGKDGFTHAVAEVAVVEQAFGLDDLAKLTVR